MLAMVSGNSYGHGSLVLLVSQYVADPRDA